MFDKIVCLSLDKRHENQKGIKESFLSKGMDAQFFLCGNGELFPKENYGHIDVVPPPGRRGYPAWVNRPNSYNAFLSFRKIVQSAKNDGVGSLLILEDDVVLLDNFDEVFPRAASQLEKDWEMFYLGAGHKFSKKIVCSPKI